MHAQKSGLGRCKSPRFLVGSVNGLNGCECSDGILVASQMRASGQAKDYTEASQDFLGAARQVVKHRL